MAVRGLQTQSVVEAGLTCLVLQQTRLLDEESQDDLKWAKRLGIERLRKD